MRIRDFALERYFARWEFAAPHLLCASDVEGWRMADLLALPDDEARGLWEGLALGYTEAAGHPLLRGEIARLYHGVEADDVLVFAGAEEAVFACLNVLLGPGDHAVATWPAYQSLTALRAADRVLARSHAIIAANLPLLDGLFARWEGTLEWVRPRAGSTAFPRLVPDVPVEAFASELRERAGVLILPGTLMGHPGSHFRIGYGRAGMPEALGRFEEHLAERFGSR